VSGDVLDLDLSGIGVRVKGLAGLPDAAAAAGSWRDRLRRDWAPYVVDSALADPFLSVEVGAGAAGFGGAWDPKAMRSELRLDGATYTVAEGAVEVDASGGASLRLDADAGERGYWAMRNLLRAALAWRMPSRGGALVHAAGLEVDGRAFAMVGPEGSGKTTWTLLGAAEGGGAISDDLLLIDGEAARPMVLGAPFRSDKRYEPRVGRWPLAALLVPRHGASTAVEPVSRLEAQSRLAANLPFVAEGLERDPRIGAVVDSLLAAVPCVRFTFPIAGPILPALRRWRG
jgi:hypothetical protein